MPVDLAGAQQYLQGVHGEGWQGTFWEIVQAKARDDLLCYGLWVHGDQHEVMLQIACSPHAYVMADLMERHTRTQRIAPPEHAKTVLTRWKVEQWLGQRTELAYAGEAAPPTSLYVMNTSEQAQKQCMTIAATLEHNRRYRQLYPHVQPDKASGWTKETLFLRRPYARPDPSLFATGIFGPYQGGRYGLIVVDDPTDQQDARSEVLMDNQRQQFSGMLLDRLTDDGAYPAECHLGCTRWGKRDIPEMLLKNPDWASLVMPCYGYWEAHPEWRWLWHGSEPTKELWRAAWPEERLEKKRREKELTENAALWQLAFLCNPTSAEGEMFKREWLRYYSPTLFDALAA